MYVTLLTYFGEKSFELAEEAARALFWAADELTRIPSPGPVQIRFGDPEQTLASLLADGKQEY